MPTSTQKAPGAGGGSVAIRGFLAQTLVALLEVAQADPPFTEITLEPAVGDEQFDFMWTDPEGTHATQVKSTRNTFEKSDAEAWAAKLEAARSTEDCRLVLVGLFAPSLAQIERIGEVRIEKRNLHLADLHEQAAQRLAKFLEGEGMSPGSGLQRELVVHALISKLEHLSARSERFTRDDFLKLLRKWVHSASTGVQARLFTTDSNVAILEIWQEKLDFLRVEEAKASGAVEKFAIKKEIETAKAKIEEYGG